MKTLREVQIRDTVTMIKLCGTGTVKRRITDTDITREAQVLVRKAVPLGDPIEAKARDYGLSLRKADARLTEVD